MRRPITVDGIVGPETIGAIAAFQTEHRRIADGRLDPFGSTLADLKRCAGRVLEGQLRGAMRAVLDDLDGRLARKCYRLPPELEGKMRSLRHYVTCLRPSLGAASGAGVGGPPSVGCACGARNSSPSAGGASRPAAPIALATAEATALVIVAALELLTLLQLLPLVADTIDEIAPKVQGMMAELIECVKTGAEGIEDIIKRMYFPRFTPSCAVAAAGGSSPMCAKDGPPRS
jgi:hypothetical protein